MERKTYENGGKWGREEKRIDAEERVEIKGRNNMNEQMLKSYQSDQHKEGDRRERKCIYSTYKEQ